MDLAERIKNSETHQFRMVMPCSLNDNGNLFGGNALKWMDEVAYITAQRYARMKMVTIAVGKVNFRKAITSGTMVELIGKVVEVGNVKLTISVEVYSESIDNRERELAIDSLFTFTAVNDQNKPVGLRIVEGNS
ncbi:MAG: acyl-CoA thioesterase [Bacteroidales bacterium]|nr:acyl-CoA thioesterase [Bacteroidales bacterium]